MSIGGDIKFLRLKQRGVEGLVCDGGIRDMHVVKDYGPLFFGYDKTSNLGTRVGTPYATNDVRSQCPPARVFKSLLALQPAAFQPSFALLFFPTCWQQMGCTAAHRTVSWEMQVISVDNVLVRPGDYILADDDGVVVIPMGVAPMIAELAIECVSVCLHSVFSNLWHTALDARCLLRRHNARCVVEPVQCSHLRLQVRRT